MKYQLSVYWKDGSISGRLVSIPWNFRDDPRGAKRIVLSPAEDAVRVRRPAKRKKEESVDR